MEIAVFSDIHGNHAAFGKCIEYALKRQIHTFIFLGDYLGEFPYPQKTMEILYSLKEKYTCFFVRGNKEDYWINRKYGNNCKWAHGNATTGALQYCYANQTEKDITFWESLPVCQEIVFEGLEPLLACHGSPNKNNEKLLPDDERTKNILEKCSHKYILCGHTHIQNVTLYKDKTVLNPGAVGVSLHGGGKAQFMLLHQDGQEWRHDFISLDYDKDIVIREMQTSGLADAAPYWTQVTEHLILTGEVSHGTVLSKAMQLCEEDNETCDWYNVSEKYWKRAIAELIGKFTPKDAVVSHLTDSLTGILKGNYGLKQERDITLREKYEIDEPLL